MRFTATIQLHASASRFSFATAPSPTTRTAIIGRICARLVIPVVAAAIAIAL
jgi:hypothetical protein